MVKWSVSVGYRRFAQRYWRRGNGRLGERTSEILEEEYWVINSCDG